jgi:hypothetical protein
MLTYLHEPLLLATHELDSEHLRHTLLLLLLLRLPHLFLAQQHLAYDVCVSIRQHTSAYVLLRRLELLEQHLLHMLQLLYTPTPIPTHPPAHTPPTTHPHIRIAPQ